MTEKYKIISTILLLCVLFPISAAAHPGGTDSVGCHTCRTNCSSWGLGYGEYHCHQSKGYTQPSYPVRSHNTGYTEPWPEYTIPDYSYDISYPAIPDCPIFSYYDSLEESCVCNYGYVADGNSCISYDSYCSNLYGYNSEYDILNDSCKCSYGYVVASSGNSCVSGDGYCRGIYGIHSEYDSIYGRCDCRYGYTIGLSGQCVSRDSYCQDMHGPNAEYDILGDSCSCKYGYVVNSTGDSCVKEASSIYRPSTYDIYTQNEDTTSSVEFSAGQMDSIKSDGCSLVYGDNALYNSKEDKCDCKDGFHFGVGGCEEVTSTREVDNIQQIASPAFSDVLKEVDEHDFDYSEENIDILEVATIERSNLRACPSLTKCEVIRTVPGGSNLVVNAKYNSWLKTSYVNSDKLVAWIHSSLVSEELLPISSNDTEAGVNDYHVAEETVIQRVVNFLKNLFR